MLFRSIFTCTTLVFSIAILFIPEQIMAQTTGLTSVCSLAGNIMISYPSSDWDAKEDYKTPEKLVLMHKDNSALFEISRQYYSGFGDSVLPDPAEYGSKVAQVYSEKLQGFQAYSSLAGSTAGEYYIQDPKFVVSNPAFLLPFSYTDPTNSMRLNIIQVFLTKGSNLYTFSFESNPNVTTSLWPIIEDMILSFYGAFGAGDRVIGVDADGRPKIC